MFSKIRSLIFKLDPELAHTLAIKALKFNFNPIKNLKKDSSIETTIFGKKLLIQLVLLQDLIKTQKSIILYLD